ncbi:MULTISPECIES: sugar ABC transporter ATP-binding protein [unclassified Rathayibacter]|uniref:sugar ABC transporter ATP-binding protein n=1 Tax=unclassified Rathayibacter TaxID=2609250 RepID=UPI001046979E|nr:MULTISPECIES: sugar ABC transporter ATP-binding protein [unclassified Rathayibacter]TCL82628.1 monosaccharide ABC transporter ATP-binding protein (CUT2 family) [Rathayibacter sp. PhB192]TCM27967.1 monosaccharide ABC transporter ATP-binding protein (CUT2 family) [Rathayibacter sp. PhB179]
MASPAVVPPPALEMAGISKSFAGVPVLRDVALTVGRGEVVALVGENGAGKSTLIKILTGLYSADAGSIAIEGAPVAITAPRDAERAGIRVVHQDRHLAGRLTVAEQLYLGHERLRRRGTSAEAVLAELVGLVVRGGTLVDDLTVAEQQQLQIARALLVEPRILVLDEPTAPLAAEEVAALFASIRRLQARGVAVIYISHYLQEVQRVASRVVVLRNGANVGGLDLIDGDAEQGARIVELMLGRDVEEFALRSDRVIAADVPPLLELEALTVPGALDALDLVVRPGEIVGVTGLVGSGVDVLADAVVGLSRRSGRVRVAGTATSSARAFVAAGGGYVPSDRRRDGVLLAHTVRENLSIASLGRISLGGLLPSRRRDRALALEQIAALDVRPADPEAVVGTLSGGNQQKVAVGKWLAAGSRVLVLDQPTAGVDIGSRAAVYALVDRLVDEGAGILLVSLDLEELVGLADRVLVLHRGAVRAELPRRELSVDRVLAIASGAVAPEALESAR